MMLMAKDTFEMECLIFSAVSEESEIKYSLCLLVWAEMKAVYIIKQAKISKSSYRII